MRHAALDERFHCGQGRRLRDLRAVDTPPRFLHLAPPGRRCYAGRSADLLLSASAVASRFPGATERLRRARRQTAGRRFPGERRFDGGCDPGAVRARVDGSVPSGGALATHSGWPQIPIATAMFGARRRAICVAGQSAHRRQRRLWQRFGHGGRIRFSFRRFEHGSNRRRDPR